ncbi:HutD/Ves family protein [Gemmobacter lutimaris]|nr:HutD family protein [Gemmobacter lutimaris]
MFRIMSPDEFQTNPWKNGGGITREVARHPVGEDWQWRISIAEVGTDGPFSLFPGMTRILTVIDGAGIDLLAVDGLLEARLHRPVHFSGDQDVNAKLVSGPVHDLNLIYDATAVEAAVNVILGPATVNCEAGTAGFLCLSGAVTVSGDGLPVGAFALGTGADIALEADATGILITLRDRA